MPQAAVRRAFSGLILFTLLALPGLSKNENIPYEWSGVEKIVVIGDLHGDYDSFIRILKGTELVGSDLHWAAGKTHFVQTGDVMDRGPEAKKIFDLLIRLEKEAAEAGGMVHVLLGNHEELNLTGIVFDSNSDYVTLDQFISFLPEGYRRKQEEALTKRLIKLRSREPTRDPEEAINEFWKSVRADPAAQRKYLLNFNEQYGPWLRRLNVAIKINDIVFVHGGIGEKYSKWGLKEINDRYRQELTDIWREYKTADLLPNHRPSHPSPAIVYRGDSPLWYRELATVPEEDLEEELDAILEALRAKAMVIAHTPRIPRRPRDMQRFGGRVWIVDTGISRVYGGPASALVIQEGVFNVWGVGDENENRPDRAGFDSLRFRPGGAGLGLARR